MSIVSLHANAQDVVQCNNTAGWYMLAGEVITSPANISCVSTLHVFIEV